VKKKPKKSKKKASKKHQNGQNIYKKLKNQRAQITYNLAAPNEPKWQNKSSKTGESSKTRTKITRNQKSTKGKRHHKGVRKQKVKHRNLNKIKSEKTERYKKHSIKTLEKNKN